MGQCSGLASALGVFAAGLRTDAGSSTDGAAVPALKSISGENLFSDVDALFEKLLSETCAHW